MDAPCKHCNRKGCGSFHDRCKRYQEYKIERKNALDSLARENEFVGCRKSHACRAPLWNPFRTHRK